MLHDISRLMSLLGDRAAHLVTTVDERLGQQAEHTRQILAATQEITRALAALAARADVGTDAVGGGGGGGGGDLAAVDGLRQALSDERTAAAELLRTIGQDLTGQLDTALRTATRTIVKPIAAQSDAVRKVVERIDAAAEAMARAGSQVEQSTGALGQKLDRLADAPGALQGGNGSTAATEDIAAIAKASREALESLAALSDQLKQTVPPTAARDRPLPRREENGGSPTSGSWAQRVSALRRTSIDLTSDLPALEIPATATPEGSRPVLESESGT
jgi:methyl-accepting chemotaxis protein